ncbi:MAG: hypothetical protein K1X74_19550 [Pirellulales bacterium]|nr:hypothetical protein [Pirellulales bacterium]
MNTHTATRAPRPLVDANVRRPASRLIAVWLLVACAAPAGSQAEGLVEIGLNFTGARYASGVGNSFSVPPDTMGTVGEAHIVELINGRYNVYDKLTGARLASNTASGFWSNAGITGGLLTDVFDPRVVYDPFSDRFYATELSSRRSSSSAILVAVSNTPNPLDGWSGFSFDADADDQTWVDFPKLGFSQQAVYVAANMFNIGTDSFSSLDVVAIPKADLIAPVPTVAQATKFENVFNVAQSDSLAVIDYDNAGARPAFVSLLQTGIDGRAGEFFINGPITSPTLSPRQFLDGFEQTIPDLNGALQPLGIMPIETSQGYAGELVRLNGSLWGVHTVDVDGRAAQHWFEVDEATKLVVQQGYIADDELEYFIGSIAVNQFGDVVIGFSGAGSAQFASSYAVVGRTNASGITTFGEPLLLKQGVSTYNRGGARNRWGDYSATVIDPSDPLRFWTFQEFAAGTNQWGIQITELHLIPEPSSWILALGGGAVLACQALARARRRNGN